MSDTKAWGDCGMCGGTGKIGLITDAYDEFCPECKQRIPEQAPCPTCLAHFKAVGEAVEKEREGCVAYCRARALIQGVELAREICEERHISQPQGGKP